ncbi:MAG TPA: GyrI-like domain-containing protein [Bryobacteraceae bacterium]|nr:GyrI-like domain-containing protein [Bryobacteraceae bacterium]
MAQTAVAEKLDLYKLHKSEYVTPKEPVLIQVGAAKYLTADGVGAPGGNAFQEAIGALYSMAYTMKMAKKFAGQDYKVCHLEGLWWGIEQMEAQNQWRWKLLIRVPDFICDRMLKATTARLKEKGKGELAVEVRLEILKEGKCVQVLHTGPYSNEGATVARMKAFVERKALAFAGVHHEIYLSDPRRVAPEKLRTILRMPVK